MPRVIVAAAAKRDARDIWIYIARDNQAAADRALARIDRTFHQLASQPLMGKAVEELGAGLRLFAVGNYLIFYRPIDDGIAVARLLHGARNITVEYFQREI